MVDNSRKQYPLEQVAEMTGFLYRPLLDDCREGRVERIYRYGQYYMTAAQIDALIAKSTIKVGTPTRDAKGKPAKKGDGREVDVEAWKARKLASLAKRTG